MTESHLRDLISIKVSRLVHSQISAVMRLFLVIIWLVKMSDALMRHPTIYLACWCEVATLLNDAEELV